MMLDACILEFERLLSYHHIWRFGWCNFLELLDTAKAPFNVDSVPDTLQEDTNHVQEPEYFPVERPWRLLF